MSSKFGLDWKEYDGRRMTKFIEVIFAETERDKVEQGKGQKESSKKKFR